MCGLSTFPPAGSSRKRNGKAAAAKEGAAAWASAKPQREQQGNPQGRGHRAQAARRGRTSPNFRAAEKKGDSAPPTAARDDPAPQREQQPGQARSLRGSSRAAASTRGADNRKRPQRGREGARKKAKARAKPGAGNPTDGARATGKRNGAGKPQGSHQHRAQAAPRRSPAARSFPHAAAKRRSKAKQGEARRSKVFCSLARARGLFPYLDTRQYLLSSENP